ncbi:MAG: Na+/H+ antiporter subunit G [Bacteroidales bacterium]|nr:Na+/H+ antiporter subunit G [Bacteroidales bacterium]
MEIIQYLGGALLIMGSLSLLIASIGLIRMPDVYNRVQTGTKASTLGAILSFLGIGLLSIENWSESNWIGRVIILIIFIIITNPVSSHILMRAAYVMKIPFTKDTKVDKLKEDIDNKVLEEPKDE